MNTIKIDYSKTPWERIMQKDLDTIKKLFTYDLSEEDRIIVFKNFCEAISLETSSYCNRKCFYCPVTFSDRGTKNLRMDFDVFKKIVYESKIMGFSGRYTLNLYNEPFADDKFLYYASYLRQEVPHAFIEVHTNGDFLDLDKLKAFEGILSRISITLHSIKHNGVPEEVAENIETYLRSKFGITDYEIVCFDDKEVNFQTIIFGIQINARSENFKEYASYRSGLISRARKLERHSPCQRIFREINIDYKGNAYVCCNIFPDAFEDSQYNLGNLRKFSLWDVFSHNLMVSFRRQLIDFSPKSGICSGCSGFIESPESFKIMDDPKYNSIIEYIKGK